MGLGTRAAGQARLRDGPDEHAVRALDGAGDGVTGLLQPHLECALADVGGAENLGAGPLGPKLADLIAEPDTTQAHGDSDSVDVLGAAYAATDGDPATAWTAPQRVVQHKTAPTLTLTLPQPTEVTGLRLSASSSSVPTHPTMVAVDLGDGPQARTLEVSGPQTLSLTPRVTDTVTISLLDWKDVIDRTAVGFDQLKPPGLAEVAALGTDGAPIAPADASRNRGRDVTVDCDHGPILAIAGRFVHTEVHTTVGALLDGAPVTAAPCDSPPIDYPPASRNWW